MELHRRKDRYSGTLILQRIVAWKSKRIFWNGKMENGRFQYSDFSGFRYQI
jgi:hypothetical protein